MLLSARPAHIATSAQRQRRCLLRRWDTGGGKSPAPRSPAMSKRILSRVRPNRVAISEAVTRSSGSICITRKPGTNSTALIAEAIASSNVGASRSKSAYCTPSTAPKVASSHPASNRSSRRASTSPWMMSVKLYSAIGLLSFCRRIRMRAFVNRAPNGPGMIAGIFRRGPDRDAASLSASRHSLPVACDGLLNHPSMSMYIGEGVLHIFLGMATTYAHG